MSDNTELYKILCTFNWQWQFTKIKLPTVSFRYITINPFNIELFFNWLFWPGKFSQTGPHFWAFSQKTSTIDINLLMTTGPPGISGAPLAQSEPAFTHLHLTLNWPPHKLTWTKYSAYKILWLVSLQIVHQNLNTSQLHWLPIKQCIDYKLCLPTFKTLEIQQPTYLYNNRSIPSHSLSTRSLIAACSWNPLQ